MTNLWIFGQRLHKIEAFFWPKSEVFFWPKIEVFFYQNDTSFRGGVCSSYILMPYYVFFKGKYRFYVLLINIPEDLQFGDNFCNDKFLFFTKSALCQG